MRLAAARAKCRISPRRGRAKKLSRRRVGLRLSESWRQTADPGHLVKTKPDPAISAAAASSATGAATSTHTQSRAAHFRKRCSGEPLPTSCSQRRACRPIPLDADRRKHRYGEHGAVACARRREQQPNRGQLLGRGGRVIADWSWTVSCVRRDSSCSQRCSRSSSGRSAEVPPSPRDSFHAGCFEPGFRETASRSRSLPPSRLCIHRKAFAAARC